MTTFEPQRLLKLADALNSGMPSEWGDGDRAMIQYALRTAAVSADLLAAAEMVENAEDNRDDCPECGGEGEPELCGACFPIFDDARVKRRAAIEKVRGRLVPLHGSGGASVVPMSKRIE